MGKTFKHFFKAERIANQIMQKHKPKMAICCQIVIMQGYDFQIWVYWGCVAPDLASKYCPKYTYMSTDLYLFWEGGRVKYFSKGGMGVGKVVFVVWGVCIPCIRVVPILQKSWYPKCKFMGPNTITLGSFIQIFNHLALKLRLHQIAQFY